jgi:F-type H+-transporting ATPase subunit b
MSTARARLVRGTLLVGILLAAPLITLAQEAAPQAQHEGQPVSHRHRGSHGAGGGGADEPGQAEGEENAADADHIVNWWSFDYGASTKDPTHHDWPPPFGWALVNFLVFAAIISKILWQPIKQGWADKHDLIKGELDEATRLRKEAEAQLVSYQHKVANVDAEVQTLLKQLHVEAEADRARLIAAAELEAKRTREEADRQIKVEIERARIELRRETVAAALKAAESLLTQSVREEDQTRLAERYAADLDKASTRGGAA